MKRCGWAIIAVLMAPAVAPAQTIGPDSFGYILTRTNNPSAFQTIAGAPGVQNLTTTLPADDRAFTVNLPFTFSAYGNNYNQVSVCTNGFLLLGPNQATDFTNLPLTGAMASASANVRNNPLLCPYWDDLIFFDAPNTGALLTLTRNSGGRQQFVVEWNGVGYFNGGPTNLATFQTILQDDGSIFYVYNNVSGPTGQANGGSSTIGMRDANGDTNGRVLQFFFGTGGQGPLNNGDLITIVVPEPGSLALCGVALVGVALRRRRRAE